MFKTDKDKIILKRTLKVKMEGHILDISGLRYGQLAGSCKHGNEISGPIQWGDLLSSCGTV